MTQPVLPLAPRERLIVALDLPNVSAAAAMVERLGDSVSFYKIGLELVYAGGLSFARDLISSGKQVFLDLKFHDIPNTVPRATEQVAGLGATYLTVHAYPQTMRPRWRAAPARTCSLLAVTVMTSLRRRGSRDGRLRDGRKGSGGRRAGQARTAASTA